jgi:glycosyltransferase involved in cell wall biosynthesis
MTAGAPASGSGGVPPRVIRVAHLLHTMAYGGVETNILNWISRLDRARFEPHLVCFALPDGTEGAFVGAAARLGHEVDKIPWSRRKPIFAARRRLVEILRDRQADILHTHNTYADIVGALAARKLPIKTITTLYVWADLGWKRNLLQRVNRWAIGNFTCISAHCQDTYEKTLAMGVPQGRVRLLICGFESHRVELEKAERLAKRRELGVADDHLLMVNIARLYPEKAQDALLRVFKHIHEGCPAARLWILGIGPLEGQLRALCTQLELDEVVSFRGFVDNLPSLLALVDMQLHPSNAEGVPLAICSGMAAGVPIVASRVGGLPEVIRDGQTGMLIAPGDEQAFVAATLELAAAPRRRASLGQAARQFIEGQYSLAQAVRNVEQTYEEMMSGCGLACP